MTLSEIVTVFVSSKIKSLKTDYTWKINTKRLPINYDVGSEDNVTENLKLRQHLHKQIQYDPQNCAAICTWYVRDWGGVRGNKIKTLDDYILATNADLIGNGTKGISTWSKILCLRDPAEYAIYDCRVAVTLAILRQKAERVEPIYFPTLKGKSQNGTIRKAQAMLTDSVASSNFYLNYCSLLKEVAGKVDPNVDIQRVEMALFANALALCAYYFDQAV
ncbi:MAG: hypothetical protein FJX04_02480 [Alphaproteobacteria bacterium]|nr:hypothetical protein [Alphaproteobacteria bacterium]